MRTGCSMTVSYTHLDVYKRQVLMVYNGTADAAGLGEKGKYTDYAEKIMERTEQLERLHGK